MLIMGLYPTLCMHLGSEQSPQEPFQQPHTSILVQKSSSLLNTHSLILEGYFFFFGWGGKMPVVCK